MLAKVNSAALYGIDALRVEVEIDLASGLPQLATVGLPEGAPRDDGPSVDPAGRSPASPLGGFPPALPVRAARAPRC